MIIVMLAMKGFFQRLTKNGSQVLFVVSAVRGVTRLLRLMVETTIGRHSNDKELKDLIISLALENFHKIHSDLITGLFVGEEANKVKIDFEKIFLDLKRCLDAYKAEDNEDKFYAQVLKFGELSSSMIFHNYLCSIGVSSTLFDARDYIITTGNHKDAVIDHTISFRELFFKENVSVTQGFIGRNSHGEDTVLGFDGSDLSATHFALTWGQSVTFWKDTKLLKEDPFLNPGAEVVTNMSNDEFQKLPTHPIRPDAVDSAIRNGLEVRMKCFLCPDDYEARIYA